MSDQYPLRGEGIEIRRKKVDEQTVRYNIHLDPQIYEIIRGASPQPGDNKTPKGNGQEKEQSSPQEGAKNKEGQYGKDDWPQNPDTKRRVVAYEVEEDKFKAAQADVKCTG